MTGGHGVPLPCQLREARTFSCALVSRFWTLMASFPAVTPFPGSAMSAVCAGVRTSEEEEDGLRERRREKKETRPTAARNSNPVDSFLKAQCVI